MSAIRLAVARDHVSLKTVLIAPQPIDAIATI